MLWLCQEDINYLNAVAEADLETNSASIRRLIKTLRKLGIKSFLGLEAHLHGRLVVLPDPRLRKNPIFARKN